MTQRCGRREDLKLSPPLSNHASESRQIPRLSDLTHLPPFGAQLASQEGPGYDQPAGVLLFSKVDGLSDLQALRLLEEFSNE